ncbi:prepilin-type N-terminal cleavage/methylation domain-containing protein [Phormidium pseudopriestleyi FRX01]|uniref:Prepilin-type N-terminal cleavage/methylation domain-containing protein n=1 Tax=Phormidium pseudopriestleyi FRX01 TaxID=1759528 RepID=A0ABS3FQN9_9CYAN|nr:type IV pilin-like G/H family protein [Phormidium pseudopriestleyi]MBO0349187.1 prepilin-type N-terminal cleavage/methylation domain-containing protein [Phormidium pseudopriestleyi FRX01]
MKTEFKAKFIQHFNQKKGEQGFTLIELLVVVIIIGILAAVALPSLLSQANKAKQVEARNNIGAMNRAQQAYNLEKPGFADAIGKLGLGIPSATTNYTYTIDGGGSASSAANNLATMKDEKLKSYRGYTFTVDVTTDNITEKVTRAIVCESEKPNVDTVAAVPDDGSGKCGGNDVKLGE